MSIDVEKTIALMPAMSEQALARLDGNVARWRRSADPAQREAAEKVAAARAKLDEPYAVTDYESLPRQERVGRLRHAFARRPASETDAKVIAVLLAHPGETSARLSGRLGWEGQAWHAHFGAACHAREDLLWRAQPSEDRDEPFYASILADFERVGSLFRIKEDLGEPLAEILGVPRSKGGLA